MQGIDVINYKGGSGKTNTAINLAGMFATRFDASVCIFDLDPQGSASLFSRLAQRNNQQIFEVVTKESQVFGKEYDYVIIDHPPNGDTSPMTDFVICPTVPDAQTMASTHRLEKSIDKDKIFFHKLLNKVQIQVRSHAEFLELPEYKDIPYISSRGAYTNLFNEGCTVFQKPQKLIARQANVRDEFERALLYCKKQYNMFKKDKTEIQEK